MSDASPQPARHWRDQAACLELDQDLFFDTTGPDANVEQAKAICASCPVQLECLTEALNRRERYGIWGGHTPDERRWRLRQLGRASWTGHHR